MENRPNALPLAQLADDGGFEEVALVSLTPVNEDLPPVVEPCNVDGGLMDGDGQRTPTNFGGWNKTGGHVSSSSVDSSFWRPRFNSRKSSSDSVFWSTDRSDYSAFSSRQNSVESEKLAVQRTPSLVDELLNEIYARFGGSDGDHFNTTASDVSPPHRYSAGSQESDGFTEYSTTSDHRPPHRIYYTQRQSQVGYQSSFDEKAKLKYRKNRLMEKSKFLVRFLAARCRFYWVI